jgi:hypothetical protein
MSGLPVFTLPLACPYSNTRETHLLVCHKAAYPTRRQLMHNHQCTLTLDQYREVRFSSVFSSVRCVATGLVNSLVCISLDELKSVREWTVFHDCGRFELNRYP